MNKPFSEEKRLASLARRFAAKVDTSGECHIWKGAARGPYGCVSVTEDGKTVTKDAHRVAWFLSSGEWPPAGMWVLHSCDNKICVRPDHLSLGTPRENVQQAIARGRRGGQVSRVRAMPMEIIDEIRREYEDGGVTQRTLGERYDISQGLISAICTYREPAHQLQRQSAA